MKMKTTINKVQIFDLKNFDFRFFHTYSFTPRDRGRDLLLTGTSGTGC